MDGQAARRSAAPTSALRKGFGGVVPEPGLVAEAWNAGRRSARSPTSSSPRRTISMSHRERSRPGRSRCPWLSCPWWRVYARHLGRGDLRRERIDGRWSWRAIHGMRMPARAHGSRQMSVPVDDAELMCAVRCWRCNTATNEPRGVVKPRSAGGTSEPVEESSKSVRWPAWTSSTLWLWAAEVLDASWPHGLRKRPRDRCCWSRPAQICDRTCLRACAMDGGWPRTVTGV
jgi:hypothetical protein